MHVRLAPTAKLRVAPAQGESAGKKTKASSTTDSWCCGALHASLLRRGQQAHVWRAARRPRSAARAGLLHWVNPGPGHCLNGANSENRRLGPSPMQVVTDSVARNRPALALSAEPAVGPKFWVGVVLLGGLDQAVRPEENLAVAVAANNALQYSYSTRKLAARC